MLNDHIDNTDFWSGQTLITDEKRKWHTHRLSDWSLIFVLSGHGQILFRNQLLNLSKGDAVLIEPNYDHYFRTENNWNLLWFHFLMRPYIYEHVGWKEIAPGFYSVCFVKQHFVSASAALHEARTLDLQRDKNWYHLAYNLLESVLLRGSSEVEHNSSDLKDKIAKAKKLLLNPLADKNIDNIAIKCGMSRSSFYAKFKHVVGVSPREYRELSALRRSQALLRNTEASISSIAEEIGMPNVYYFSNRFKKFSGYTPSAFRKIRKS